MLEVLVKIYGEKKMRRSTVWLRDPLSFYLEIFPNYDAILLSLNSRELVQTYYRNVFGNEERG